MIVSKNINYPAPKQEYKVLVRCFTFNHSQYIEDALNGFAMQRTTFPFVCLVMDDASTDGEQDVIKAWIERECDMSRVETIEIPTSVVIIIPHKINTFCTFAFYLLKQNLYGTGDKKMSHVYPWRKKCEYEALCEGDDYWIDPTKLQEQVLFLSTNKKYSVCSSNYKILFDRSKHFEERKISNAWHETLESYVINKPYLCPPSWLYRIDLLKSYEPILGVDGSFVQFAHFLSHGKAYIFDKCFSVRRVIAESASKSRDPQKLLTYLNGVFILQMKLIERYRLSQSIRTQCINSYYSDNTVLGLLVKTKSYSELRKADNLIDKKTISQYLLIVFGKSKFTNLIIGSIYTLRNKIHSLILSR